MVRSHIPGAGTVLLLITAVGCGASSGSSPPATPSPVPTPPLLPTAPPVTAVPGATATVPARPPTTRHTAVPVTAPTVLSVANGFSTALVQHDAASAVSYLSAPLQARARSLGVKRLLGLPRFPISFQYAITSSGPSRATMQLIYQYTGGSTTDSTTLVRTSIGWRITSIQAG